MGVVTDKDIISELISLVGPQSIVWLISEKTFKDNDIDVVRGEDSKEIGCLTKL